MRVHFITFLCFTAATVNATVRHGQTYINGPCKGANGVTGVCVSRDSCNRDGGNYIHNACLGTPEDIKCCTKPSCQKAAQMGDCRWTKDCDGGKPIVKNLCPGPAGYRCCITSQLTILTNPLRPTETPTSGVRILTNPLRPTETPTSDGYPASGNSTAPSATPSPSSKSSVKPTPTPKPKPKPKPTPKPKPKPKETVGEKILKKAKEAEGIPYNWGGGSCKGKTGGGFDCSGLVSWAVCQVTGRDLFTEGLRVTRDMYCASEKKLKYKKIPWKDRRAGDAVFFGGKCNCKTYRKGIHHVGLMMDDGWTMWNALKTGTRIRKDNFKNWSEKPCPYVIRFGD